MTNKREKCTDNYKNGKPCRNYLPCRFHGENREKTGKIGKNSPPVETQFKKGESGNPAGRPKGSKNRSTVLSRWIELETKFANTDTRGAKIFDELDTNIKITVEDEIALALIKEARKGNIPAIKEIFDTIYGKLKDTHDINLTNVSDLSDDELQSIIES